MIRGKNVHLRTVRESDLDLYYERICDVEGTGQYQYYCIFVPSEAEFKRNFHEHGFWDDDHGELLICDSDDHILGVILFYRAAPYFDGFEIAARIFDVELRNRGIMTEALTLFTYLLFTIKKINRLELKIMPANAPSKRVAERCGYKFEGVARGAVFHRGAPAGHGSLFHFAPGSACHAGRGSGENRQVLGDESATTPPRHSNGEFATILFLR